MHEELVLEDGDVLENVGLTLSDRTKTAEVRQDLVERKGTQDLVGAPSRAYSSGARGTHPQRSLSWDAGKTQERLSSG